MNCEKSAIELLKCALAWEPEVRLLGNVTAKEIAVIAGTAICTCPQCGAMAWCNIDCDLCNLMDKLENDT